VARRLVAPIRHLPKPGLRPDHRYAECGVAIDAQRFRPPRWANQMLNATEAITAMLSRMVVVIAVIYRLATRHRNR
jgi:hypothetical protein